MYRIIASNPDGSAYTIYDPVNSGALPVISPRQTEELNEAGSLEFALVYGHAAYDQLIPKKTYITAELDGEEIFYGRVINAEPNALTRQIQYNCAGSLSFLQDSELLADAKNSDGSTASQSMTAEAFFERCIQSHNRDVGSDSRRLFEVGVVNHPSKDTVSTYQISSNMETLSAIKQYLLDTFGGFLRVRKGLNGTHLIDWVEQYGDTDEGTLELGENIISLAHRFSSDNVFTAIRPIGANNTVLPNDEVMDVFGSEEMAQYGRIVKTVQFKSADTVEKLRTACQEMINRMHKTLYISSEISLLDMHFVDGLDHGVNLGDVYTNIHGLEGTAMTVSARNRDFNSPQNDSVSLKNAKEFDGGKTWDSGGSSSISKRSARSAAAGGMAYKYIHEFQDRLELNAKEIGIHAEQLGLHADQLEITSNELVSLSRADDELYDELGAIKGTAVIQNSSEIAAVAGRFIYDETSHTLEMIDGTEFRIHDTDGAAINVRDRLNGLAASITETKEEIRTDVSAANSAIYTYIRQTATNIETMLQDTEEGLYSYTNETVSGIHRVMMNTTNRVWVQDTDPTTEAGGGNTAKDGDMWVESTHQGSWDGAEGFDWEHDEGYDWTQIQGAKIWSWANNKWELVSDQQQTISYSEMIDSIDYYLNLKMKGIVNDEGLVDVYMSKLEQTAIQIRSEVSAVGSSVYSYINETATSINIGVGARPTVISQSSEKGAGQPTTVNGRAPVNNDIWIDTEFIDSWDDALDFSWNDEDSIDWAKLRSDKIYVYKDGEWHLAEDGTVLAEDTDLQVESNHIALLARNIDTLDGYARENFAQIQVRANQIYSEVLDKTNDLGSRITQTATQIRSEVHSSNSQVYSYISQTSTQIKTFVGNSISDVYSSITQTASSIRSEVHSTHSQIYSSIMQTASQIRMEVGNSISGVRSSITQTASQIRTEVNAANSKIYSSITQTASQIRTEVANTVSGLRSSITQNADKIALIVDSNDKIKPAQIVAAINNGASSIIISADHIDLDGYVKATDLTTDYFKGKIASISNMDIKSATVTGSLYVRNGSGTSQNVSAAIWDLWLYQSGNTYTLRRKRISDSDWVDVGSFSRATSLRGAWSGNTYTVTASPQGNSTSTSVGSRFNVVSGIYYIAATNTDSRGNVTDLASTTYKLGLSGTSVQIQNSSGTQYSNTPSYTIPLETRTVTANGTYTPNSGKVGISSITVDVPATTITDCAVYDEDSDGNPIKTTSITISSAKTLWAGYYKNGSFTWAGGITITPTVGNINIQTSGTSSYSGLLLGPANIAPMINFTQLFSNPSTTARYYKFEVQVNGKTKAYYIDRNTLS